MTRELLTLYLEETLKLKNVAIHSYFKSKGVIRNGATITVAHFTILTTENGRQIDIKDYRYEEEESKYLDWEKDYIRRLKITKIKRIQEINGDR